MEPSCEQLTLGRWLTHARLQASADHASQVILLSHSWQNLEELKELAGLPSSISFPSQPQSYTEACAIKPDPEDCESVSSDLDSQATEVYEPVLGPTTPAQLVRAAAGG